MRAILTFLCVIIYYIKFLTASQANIGGQKQGIFQKAINNLRFSAYNIKVEEITITQNGYNGSYMSYLYGKVQQRFSFLPTDMEIKRDGDCMEIALKTERAYCPYVRKFTEENIADVIAVGYKYAFFDKRLPLPLLPTESRRLFLTALVAADFKEDKAYVIRRLRGCNNYSLDGVFHFRLTELKKRWEGVLEYVNAETGSVAVDNFLEFLTEDGEEKIFIQEGKAYDKDYRLLTRSALTGKSSITGEIMLGGGGKIYCFGEVDGETERFLKKYYDGRAVFC